MDDVVAAWKYSDTVDTSRRSSLAVPASYEELVHLVVEDVRGVKVRAEPGRDPGLTDCMQAIFDFELPNTGDPLFNGPFGYRAQYWKGANQALAANGELLAALAPKLIGAIDLSAELQLEGFDVCASLQAASAKLWIQELPSWLAQPTADLAVDRWVAEAHRGVQLARWGICAMPVTKFQVKGALLDPSGNEVVPARKICRHYDINQYGFA